MRLRQGPSVLLLAVLSVGMAGCALPGSRAAVDDVQARSVLTRAIDLAATTDLGGLCALSPADVTTCVESVADVGDLRPEEAPTVRCSVPAPGFGPLRNGHVLVLEGIDADGEAYTTDFVVYDDGRRTVVLDAVWWSGLTVVSYDEETVTWRFDSTTTTCARGGLPAERDAG